MYRYHRFTFNKHATKIGILFIITLITLLLDLYEQVTQFYAFSCMMSTQGLDSDADLAWYDPSFPEDEQGICRWYSNLFYGGFANLKNFSNVQHYTNWTIFVPILAFLLLDQPHDCYTCLGKDPDRIYSIFQLN